MFKKFTLRFLMACLLIGGSCHSYALTIEGLDLSVRTGSACEELTRPQAMKSSSESSLLRIRPCLTQGQSGQGSIVEMEAWLNFVSPKKEGIQSLGIRHELEEGRGTAQLGIRNRGRVHLLWRRNANIL